MVGTVAVKLGDIREGRSKDREDIPIDTDRVGPEHDDRTPDLPFGESSFDMMQSDFIIIGDTSMSGTSF